MYDYREKHQIHGWIDRVKQPISPNSSKSSNISIKGNPDGALYEEVVVFTGALNIPRRDAAELAANAGCEVVSTVKKSTTILVVGDQDIRQLAGHEKSSKQRKAEEMIKNGQNIRILCESEFRRLVE